MRNRLKQLVNNLYGLVYRSYLRLFLIPKTKKIMRSLQNNPEYDKYGKEIDYILNNKVDFVPYSTDIPALFEFKMGYDKDKHLPYALYLGKRLYMQKGTGKKEIQRSLASFYSEQADVSPHLYVDRNDDFFKINVEENRPVIIDCGSAEGNFTLEYIDKVSKAYLFEADPLWNAPLDATFEPWKEKTVIVNKFISDVSGGDYVSLDDYFADMHGEKVFLKMDLEGWGLKAIKGAKRLLDNNDVFVACASYHSKTEYDDIKEYLKNNHPDYRVTHSNGYALYWFDRHLEAPYFRRGMLRARKEIGKFSRKSK